MIYKINLLLLFVENWKR